MTDVQVTHEHGQHLAVSACGVELLRYVYRPDPDPFEAAKPYLHPLRTLAGDLVTGYRPNDHRWHKGLQLAISHLSGHNLWGGNSYVHGQGYLRLPEIVGSMRHDGFDTIDVGPDRLELGERLTWFSGGGEHWADERRTIVVSDVDIDAGRWSLVWSTDVTNARSEPLVFGSPTTAGRELAGYTGLAWRGPRDFAGGQVVGPEGRPEGTDLMGQPADWLAFSAVHDDVDRSSGLLFEHAPGNPPEAKWMVRSTPFPLVNPSLAFDQELELAPGNAMRRSYRVVVTNGEWTRDSVEKYRAERPWPDTGGSA